MTGWAGGYVADIAYQPGFYRDQTPSHLDLVCHLEGVHAPRVEGEPFRYCELGCGLGETALLIAALHPEAEVVGYDFNPAHIDSARALARATGVANVRFEEKSFAEIAQEPAESHASFDYITLHGIWTWVARERQLEILDILNTRLRPGGLAYVTYNSLPYWAESIAFQRLVLDLAETASGRSDERINEALDVVADIQAAGAPILRKAHLDSVMAKRNRDSAYLAHEYLNHNSRPIYHADLVKDLAAVKLDYVGSAIALDNFPAIIFDDAQRAVLDRLPMSVRATVGDFFYPHLFRRDVFVRGARPLPRLAREAALLDRTLALATQADDVSLKTRTAQKEVSFDAPFYPFLVEELARQPASLRDAAGRFPDVAIPDPREVLAFGLQTTQVLTVWPQNDTGRIRAVNLAIVAAALDEGRPGTAIAAGAVRTGLHLDLPEMMIYLALAQGVPEEVDPLVDFVARFLSRRGATLRKDATPDGKGGIENLKEAARKAIARKVPVWRSLGAL